MKKIILLLFAAVILTNCEKDNNNNNSGIVIKGQISSQKNSGNSLSDAKKILVVKVHIGTLISSFVDIIDGSFTLSTEMGIITALVFLDENNQYIGTLSSRGLNFLPLCNLTNGENTIIDLLTLTLVGTSVIPSHDPFGNEIIITEAEINSLKEVDGFFKTLAKNIDADNDGILDVLNNKQLYISTRFHISAGHWGHNSSVPVISENALDDLGYSLEINGDIGFSCPDNIVLSGPEDSAYNDITTHFINPDGNGGFYSGIWRNTGSSLLSFKKGTYTLDIDGNAYTLDYSSVDARLSLLLVIPTLHTNSKGKLVSISLEYKLPDNTDINPVNILTDVMVQLNDASANQFYDTPRLINMYDNIEGCDCVKGLFSYTLDTPLDISTLERITVGYNDLLGNTYMTNWYK